MLHPDVFGVRGAAVLVMLGMIGLAARERWQARRAAARKGQR